MDRWRGRRRAGLVALTLLAVALTGAVALSRDGGAHWIVVRDGGGAELARAALPASGEFVLRYRNSVYDSLADEHYRASSDHLELVRLSADELAVLEEYSTAVGAVRDTSASDLAWSVAVERPSIALPLRIQATELGERTLLTANGEIALWRLVAGRDESLVILAIEGETG